MQIRDLQIITDGQERGASLVANRSFQVGEVIYDFRSAPVSDEQTYQTIQVGPAAHVLVNEVLAKLNHSCSPSVIVDTERRFILANKAIQVNEELTYFYPSTEWDIVEPFQCHCNHKNCLGWIRGAQHLPLIKLSEYFINLHIRYMALQTLSRLDLP